ncbi:hypothetical protein [Pedobacter sp. B4-66]|uniref:hypothetical protein n=1 Tax=Pedobacter sp. B4-66 TaxID=2817280 RepID=UPI001BDA01D1|nr:hypothetical protein [Pedobacter sp. B4-66]
MKNSVIYCSEAYILGCLFVLLNFSSAKAQLDSSSNYFLKKGKVYTGVTFGFDNSKIENEDRLIVLIEDRKNNSFDAKFDGGYFIKDNWSVGGLINYGSSRREGVDVSTQNIRSQVNQASKFWGIYGTTKFYIPLEAKNRFFLFSEVLLGGSFNNQLKESTTDAVLTRTFIKDRVAELRFVPGIMIKVVRGFGVETGAQIAGVNAKWSRTMVNGEPYTKKESVSANLSINLLRLSLGFYYFF